MGAEATCVLRTNGSSHPGRALLETDEPIFRGADGFRLRLPLASIKSARAVGGQLQLDAANAPVTLELGTAAERWAERIRSPAALQKLATISKSIARDGAVWVVHPKGTEAKVKDTDVFAAGKKVGLTATKVARFSETHTAEKLVIPVAKR